MNVYTSVPERPRLNFAFYDSEDVRLFSYYPYGRYVTYYDIAENEEIIGVYGHNKSNQLFDSFGFIVKVNPN